MTPFRVVVHISLRSQFDKCLADPSRCEAFKTALRKLKAEPLSVGRILRGLKKDRVGRVRKLWVGGRAGHRLIYYVPVRPLSEKLWPVIPLFLSEVLRGDFDWQKVNPNTVGKEIVDDLVAGRHDRFLDYTNAI